MNQRNLDNVRTRSFFKFIGPRQVYRHSIELASSGELQVYSRRVIQEYTLMLLIDFFLYLADWETPDLIHLIYGSRGRYWLKQSWRIEAQQFCIEPMVHALEHSEDADMATVAEMVPVVLGDSRSIVEELMGQHQNTPVYSNDIAALDRLYAVLLSPSGHILRIDAESLLLLHGNKLHIVVPMPEIIKVLRIKRHDLSSQQPLQE